MFKPSCAKRAACSIGTILDRLVPCMSGSSKRTLRIPFSFHSERTRSTETDFFSAIAMGQLPAAVVPPAYLEPELPHERRHVAGAALMQHREHATLSPVTPQQRVGDRSRRLEVVALPSERRVGVAHDYERAARAADQHRELDVMADVPIGGRPGRRLPVQLRQDLLWRRMAAPPLARAHGATQPRAESGRIADEPLHPLGVPGAADGHRAQLAPTRLLDDPDQAGRRCAGLLRSNVRQLDAVLSLAHRAARDAWFAVRLGALPPGAQLHDVLVERLAVPLVKARVVQDAGCPERAAKVVLLLPARSRDGGGPHLQTLLM